MSVKKTSEKKEYSTWIHFSFNLVMLMLPATYGLFSTQFFYFYETVIKLDVIFVGLANVLFVVWDSINDPIIGFLSDRKNRFTQKYGRRFPFIVIFGIPTILSLVLLFLPLPFNAQVNPWPIFIWMIIWLFLHEFGYTAVSLTRALFPEKFRSDKERRKNSGIGIITYNLGLFIGLIIPFIFISKSDPYSYITASLILMIPCMISFFLGIPGIREESDIIDRALEVEKEPFMTTMKKAVKRKNFIVFTFVNITIQLFAACLLASINYWVESILLLPEGNQADVILMILWFLAGLASVILWIRIAAKLGQKKTQFIGLIGIILSIIPVYFVRTLEGAIVSFIILGVAAGANTFIKYPIFGDIIDEITIEEEKRQEGVYQGILVFFDRIGILLQPIIFTVVHLLTNYNPDTASQTIIAQQGILSAMTWIPALFMLIAAVVFWKYYDLTPEKSANIKKKLEELQL